MSCINSLHRNQRKVAMGRNLSLSSYSNVIEGSLPLKARKSPLHSLALAVEGLPGRGVLEYSQLSR